ncbi:hypothetical protein ACIO53_33955 [Streptomyces sp. NPDC087305]|uniref:hypothetical protein n=1 Tax=Streptomyces sp. NPDC087305 TaxID=3365781 RepID=UPI003825A6DC
MLIDPALPFHSAAASQAIPALFQWYMGHPQHLGRLHGGRRSSDYNGPDCSAEPRARRAT